MKSLILTAIMIILSGCSRETGTSTTGENRETSRHDSRTCGYGYPSMNLRIPLSDYVVDSHKPFPLKMKIVVSFNDQKIEFINECTAGTGTDFTVKRKTDSGQLIFQAQRGLFYEGIEMEITDMGPHCDNDAIFFAGTIKPVVYAVKDERDRALIDLQN